jgi:hypothetical protein
MLLTELTHAQVQAVYVMSNRGCHDARDGPGSCHYQPGCCWYWFIYTPT